MSDPWDVAMQVYDDLMEEEAYHAEKDREIEEAQRQAPPVFEVDTGECHRCSRDAYLPPHMGGCYCA